MLNISLQCCALAMLIVIFVIFICERALDLSSRRLYFYSLISCIVCLILDISSVVCIHNAVTGTMPPALTIIVCKLYLISLVIMGFEGFSYAGGEFFSLHAHLGLRRLYRTSLVLSIILILVLPLSYYMQGRVVYSYGPATIVTYIFAVLYIISTIGMALHHIDTISKRRRRAILLWQFCWITAAAIQFFNPELLLVSFGATLGMVLLYAELENPHEGIDRTSGLFSSNAFLDYITDRYRYMKRFSCISIRYENPNQATDWERERTIKVRIANYLLTFTDAYAFRNDDNEFMLVFSNDAEMERVLTELTTNLYDLIHIPLRYRYVMIQDSLIADNSEEFFKLHRYLLTRSHDQEVTIADDNAIAHIREYSIVKEMIESAMEEDRVEVFFQPMYNVHLKKFTTAEALVRIRDRDGEIVPPGKFIPVAEENGLIIPLGEEIFRQVCRLLATGEPTRLGIEYIEVNLSVAQFDQENLAETFFDIADKYGVDSAVINLEITETASTSAKLILLNNMKKFLEKGVRFSLDDFGTGRSNLDYFIEMPVDIIKFDYKFTQSYFTNTKTKEVMESIIGMFHRMDMKIVSEGVETKEQFEAMCRLGINYIQGFYFSKPLPKVEFLRFLAEKNGV